jgi:hypothetical protein
VNYPHPQLKLFLLAEGKGKKQRKLPIKAIAKIFVGM